MKFYFAGKIGHTDWRHTLVPGLREMDSANYEHHPRNGRPDEGLTFPEEWPIMPGAIIGGHDYCGPYFMSDDHGCYHGRNNHGNAPEGCCGPLWAPSDTGNEHGGYTDDNSALSRQHIVALCARAIQACDIVFAWIDCTTAYGTLVELGIAVAQGKQIWWGQRRDNYDLDDLWFARTLANEIQVASTAKAAFNAILERQAPPINGYVYLLQSGTHFKIGKSKNVDQRVTQISPKTPLPVEHIHTIASDDMSWAEWVLHRKYAKYRTNGEWFALPADAVAWLKQQTYLRRS